MPNASDRERSFVTGERDGRRFMIVESMWPKAMAQTFARLEWLIDDKNDIEAEQVRLPDDPPERWAWLMWEPVR